MAQRSRPLKQIVFVEKRAAAESRFFQVFVLSTQRLIRTGASVTRTVSTVLPMMCLYRVALPSFTASMTHAWGAPPLTLHLVSSL